MYFNTSSFAQYVPMFEMKLGKNVPLHAMLVVKDINILLGHYETDMIIDYTLIVKLSNNDNKQEIYYDEFKMNTQANIKVNDDIAYVTLL
jgi:hypothetical protein